MKLGEQLELDMAMFGIAVLQHDGNELVRVDPTSVCFDTGDSGDEHCESARSEPTHRPESPVTRTKEHRMTALVKKDQAALVHQFGGLMDATPIDRRDFLIPKLLLMQGVSKLVQEEKARAGEIRGSIDQNKIAEREGSVEIIPFSMYKTWVTLTKQGSEFVHQEPLTPDNCNKPREQILDGVEVQNFETLNYYCILPEEITKGAYLPYVVSFRSTSYQAGKTLETHRARLQDFGVPLPFKTFHLGSAAKKNDKGSFFVYTIAESRDTTEDELKAVKHWHDIVKQGESKVDESELKERNASTASPSRGVQAGDEY